MRRDAYFSLCSLHQACDRPPKLPQHQLQAGGEDDGVPGPGRPGHPAQQQGGEPPHGHLEGTPTHLDEDTAHTLLKLNEEQILQHMSIEDIFKT